MTLESKSTSSTKKKKSNNFDIYLASSSPRRAEILENLKVNFEMLVKTFLETWMYGILLNDLLIFEYLNIEK